MGRKTRVVEIRCVRCSSTWQYEGPLEAARCVACGSRTVVGVSTSALPMLLLIATSALVCYVLLHPEALARLLGL